MRTVVPMEHGTLGLNWLWLPTWVGMNAHLVAKLEAELKTMVVGQVLTAELLDACDQRVIELVCAQTNLEGVADYLDGLKFVGQS